MVERASITITQNLNKSQHSGLGPVKMIQSSQKTVLSTEKVLVTVIWNSKVIIRFDYLQKGRTLKGEYYTAVLSQSNELPKAVKPSLGKKEILFHQDNNPAQTFSVSMAKL